MAIEFRARRHGFSFVELIVCVLVMGILAGVIAPRFEEAMSFTELKNAANRLASDLRRAQRIAVNQAAGQGIEFDADADSYRAVVGANDAILDISRAGADLAVRYAAGGSLVRIASADFDGAAELIFDFRGDPSAAGSVVLTAGTRTATVSVSETGIVSVAL